MAPLNVSDLNEIWSKSIITFEIRTTNVVLTSNTQMTIQCLNVTQCLLQMRRRREYTEKTTYAYDNGGCK